MFVRTDRIVGVSNYFCPHCDAALPAEAINITEGVALCLACQKLIRLSELIDCERPSDAVLNDPPAGFRLVNEIEGVSIHVSLRSIGGMFATLGACLFWNSIVSMFLLLALAGLYSNLIGPLPDGLPAPDGEPISLGMTLFLCLFLTPFVMVGLGLIGAVFINAAGRTVVRISRDSARISTGVGPMKWSTRFDPRSVKQITRDYTKWQSNGVHKELIEIRANRTVRFGSMMSDEKRQWLLAILRSLLMDRQESRRSSTRQGISA